MKINNKKTQLVSISGSNEARITANVRPTKDEVIELGTQLKIVGFWFGDKPTVLLHVEKMISKFYSRIWVLWHQKWSRVPPVDIHLLYNSLVRPVLDFAVPVYHSLLTKDQAESLERLQVQALRSSTEGTWRTKQCWKVQALRLCTSDDNDLSISLP